MSLPDDFKMYARFIWGLPSFMRNPISLPEARELVLARMANRESNFLQVIKKGIFGYARSPYLPLLKWAGAEYGDIEAMVRTQGLEAALRNLREAGVYIGFEEFKGRQPLVRNGLELPLTAQDFDNPYLKRHFETQTSGSSGAGTRVCHELDFLANNLAPLIMLGMDAHGHLGAPEGIWRGVLPENSGTNFVLNRIKIGLKPPKWFTPITTQTLKPGLRFRIASQYIILLSRLLGKGISRPQGVRLDQPLVIAKWIARTIEEKGRCVFSTSASNILRICLAAREAGLNLKGATFMAGGEPLTPGKLRQIEKSGAECSSIYFFSEIGAVAWGCAHPAGGVDMHVFKDVLALIQYPRRLPSAEITLQAFNYTALLPQGPKIMLNVESDDFGIIETRSCGCPLESYGFTEHIRQIRSFSKLTGDGVTLVGSEMEGILETVLPEKLGGTPLDYQWVEEETSQGFTRLSLYIDPKIDVGDEEEALRIVTRAMKQGSLAAEMAQEMWNQGGTLQIRRQKPVKTPSGKQMALHVASRVKQNG